MRYSDLGTHQENKVFQFFSENLFPSSISVLVVNQTKQSSGELLSISETSLIIHNNFMFIWDVEMH